MSVNKPITWLPAFAAMSCLAIGLATSALGQEGNQQNDQNYSNSQNRDASERGSYRADQDSEQANDARQRRAQADQDFNSQQQDQRQDSPDRQSRSQRGQDGGLGISIVDGNRGLRVLDVTPNSPAQQAGLRPGDEVLSMNNEDARSPQQFVEFVAQQQPGSQVEIRYLRNGEERTVRATLESRREALNMDRQGDRMSRRDDGQGSQEERYFRGGSPPWGDDEVANHVQNLEEEIRMLTREIQDLRAMLEDDPSTRQFEMSDQSSGAQDRNLSGRQDDRSMSGQGNRQRQYDGDDRMRNNGNSRNDANNTTSRPNNER